MPIQKFDEFDRKKVISEVETYFNVKLSRVGTRRKYLKDLTGRAYWIFGGVDDWHGIPLDMMQAEESRSIEGVLIIAKRNLNSIDIYFGALRTLIENKKALSHTKTGDFQFNLRSSGNKHFILEIPELVLTKIGDTPYSEIEKISDKNVVKIENMISKLSQDEQAKLFAELKFRPEKPKSEQLT
jgi:hypothetical protein